MHVRASLVIGLPVCEESDREPIGTLGAPLIDPDTGRIEGFAVRISRGFLPYQELFLSVMDIVRFGVRVTIRSRDALSEPGDILRLVALRSSRRPMLGQPIRTERGRALGRCDDVQFETLHFRLEWLFPRRWYGWGVPVPVTAIVAVETTAIVIRESTVTATDVPAEATTRAPMSVAETTC